MGARALQRLPRGAELIIAVILAAPRHGRGPSANDRPHFSPLITHLPGAQDRAAPIIMLFLGWVSLEIFIISLILYFQILCSRATRYAVRPELILSVRSLGARRRPCCGMSTSPLCCAILSALRITAQRRLRCSSSRRPLHPQRPGLLHIVRRGEGGLMPHVTRDRRQAVMGLSSMLPRVPRPPALRLGQAGVVTRGWLVTTWLESVIPAPPKASAYGLPWETHAQLSRQVEDSPHLTLSPRRGDRSRSAFTLSRILHPLSRGMYRPGIWVTLPNSEIS